MERRKRIKLGNQEIDVIPVTFQSAGENWNEYLLSDGSVVKLKAVATEFMRIEGAYDAEGNPQYVCRSTNVMAVFPPDNLRRPGG